jgi:hypothetical protein
MRKVMLVLAMFGLGTLCWAGSAREDATDRLDKATTVLHEIMGMPEKGIPEEVLEHVFRSLLEAPFRGLPGCSLP